MRTYPIYLPWRHPAWLNMNELICAYMYVGTYIFIFIYLSIHTYTRIRTGKLHRYAYTCDGGRPMLDRETRMSPRRRLQLPWGSFPG